MRRVERTIARFAIATALCTAVVPLPAAAQGTLNDQLTSRARGDGQSRLLVEAKELVYDNDRNTVSARGDVELNYQGRTLQADRVVYDRNTGRVRAEGNARLTESDGSVVTGDQFELTDDFKSGFIDSLRVEQSTTDNGVAVKTRFSAPRAERIEGETTVFERGTYTACEPCKENPQRPPLWQVKATKIVHNNSERTIYYENATLEFAGVPIAYIPYFWSPDPTVKRKTGFLAPRYIASSSLGTGISTPFFWELAPNYDLTLTPTYLSKQGVLGQAEWRHRLLTGSYSIRAAGIFQQGGSSFLPSPLGARERDRRGSIESVGRFHINEQWRVGWDVALLSDKWFLQNYRIRSESLAITYNGFKESISTAYLQGQGDRSFFDARGYYFKGLSSLDWQKQLPVVHPVVDYNKRFNGPAPLGGEIGVDVNVTSLTRDATQFSSLTGANRNYLFLNTPYYGYYDSCLVFERGKCLVRGVAGTTTRASAEVSWRRRFVDDFGQVFTPFAYFRGDLVAFQPNLKGYENPQLQSFIGGDNDVVARAMPAVGLEYRYPFVGELGAWGTQTLEPIAQVIARPNETRIGRLPNEDAQSLVFDDTSLFDWDKFSGYDRVEGGVRANIAAKYAITGGRDFYADALVGQSFHLAGRNSFEIGDLVNTGRDSGLDSKRSDYVARVHVAPNKSISFTARGRYDQNDLSLRRFEASATASFNPWLPLSVTTMYARYAPQLELGFDRRREGILNAASYQLTPNWSVTGTALVDFDRYLNAKDTFATNYLNEVAKGDLGNPASVVYRRSTPYNVTAMSLGLGYADECTVFNVTYSVTPKDFASGTKESVQTLLFRLELRTLGAANVKQNVGDVTPVQDGIATRPTTTP